MAGNFLQKKSRGGAVRSNGEASDVGRQSNEEKPVAVVFIPFCSILVLLGCDQFFPAPCPVRRRLVILPAGGFEEIAGISPRLAFGRASMHLSLLDLV